MKFSHHALLMAILPLSMHKYAAAASSPANTVAVSTDQDDQASVPEADEQKRSLQMKSRLWRVLDNSAAFSWRISYLEYYPTSDCTGNAHDSDSFNKNSSSGHNSVGNAFVDDNSFWEDADSERNPKYIEITANYELDVKCVSLKQPESEHAVSSIAVQAYDSEFKGWKFQFKGLVKVGSNVVGISPETPDTPKPTPKVTPAPSAALKDKYDIKVNSKATFIFDKNSIGNEMTTWYYVAGEYLTKIILTFFKVDFDGKSCGGGITAGQMKMVSGPEEVGRSGGGGTLIAEIKVDMDLPNIVQKEEIYKKLSDTTGEFLVCVRADVVEDGGDTGATGANVIKLSDGSEGVSVSFTETIYKVTLDVAQGFESADVTAVKVVDPIVDATAETKYGVSACQCDSFVSTECAAKSMNQNSVLDICVELDDAADGVVIGDIKTLNLEQGSISVKAIFGSTANSLTEVSGKDSKDVVIKTRLISGFFTDASAGKSISVSGTVLVKFMNSNKPLRQLASLADLSRDLQVNDGDVASEEDFSFDIELEAEASAPASGISMSFVGNTVIVAAIVGIGGMM